MQTLSFQWGCSVCEATIVRVGQEIFKLVPSEGWLSGTPNDQS